MAVSPAVAQGTPGAIILEARDTTARISPLAVGSWALYDFANTMFSMNVVSTYFPLFIKERGENDAVYAYPMSAALLVVALIMPWLGALSDRMGRRMPSLMGFTLLCITATALMGLVSDLWLVILLYVIASIGYQTALVFYDALLPSVSTTLNWGKVSGLGVGLGYAGALAGLTIASFIVGDGSNQAAFLPTAGLFLLFAVPCFLFVRERRAQPRDTIEQPRATWRDAITQTLRSIKEARKVPGLFRFLIANFFYSDALNTVIIAMSVYAVEVIGFSSPLTVLGPAIVTAVLGSWLFGFVTDRLTAKWSLVISLLMWVGVFLAAMFITDKAIFQWVIAPVAGIALGSTWTAARTMMVELSPPARLGEFMGIYNLTGKFAAVISPILWGTTLLIIDPDVYGQFAYQVAIGTLLVMVVVGLILHLRTPNIKRIRSTQI
jgi:UMF1 family MFS transporter